MSRDPQATQHKQQAHIDECERVEVERRFGLAKRKCGMGLITARLRETTAHVIVMSILALNLRRIQHALLPLCAILFSCLVPQDNTPLVQ